MANRRLKPLRVIVGMILMIGFAAGVLAIVVRHAGGWGVPYFSFISERGSRCVNNLTGYTCDPTSLADIELFGGVDLPPDTRVVRSIYRSTHDYRLDAVLEVPPDSAAAALSGLNEAYGKCGAAQPPPLDTAGMTEVCVIVNPGTDPDTGEPSSRTYIVGTGLRADGSRAVAMSVRSR